MGLFSWVAEGISAVGEKAADGIYAFGDKAADGISWGLNAAAGVIDVIGDGIEKATEVADQIVDISGDVFETSVDLSGDLVKNTFDLGGDLVEYGFDKTGDVVEFAGEAVGGGGNALADWIGQRMSDMTKGTGDVLDWAFSTAGKSETGNKIGGTFDSWGDSIQTGMDAVGDGLQRGSSALGRGADFGLDILGQVINHGLDSTGAGIDDGLDWLGRKGNAIVDGVGKSISGFGTLTNKAMDFGADTIKVGGMLLSTLVRAKYTVLSASVEGVLVSNACVQCRWTQFTSDTAGSLAGDLYGTFGPERAEKILGQIADKTPSDPTDVCNDPNAKDIKECDGLKLDTGNCSENKEENHEPITEADCKKNPDQMESIYYVNGINTNKKAACKTAKILARATCSKIIPIYNATAGMGGDLHESLQNIKRTSRAPATRTLTEDLYEKLTQTNVEPVTIFAHSQGGLVTQEALKSLYARLVIVYGPDNATELLGNIKVKSFGTATDGWIKGPVYEHYVNTADPVPKVITEVQKKMPDYDDKSQFDDTKPFYFKDGAHWSPIAPHNMDDVYVNQYILRHTKSP